MALTETVLIVDDEKNTRDGLRDALEEHFEVFVAADIDGAMALLDSDPVDILLTDLRLGGESGMELMEKALRLKKPPICIMITAYGSVDTAVEAMRRGAYDFVTKPVNIDRLEMLIRRALRERAVVRENVELKARIQRPAGLERLLGRSAAMEEVFEIIKQVAPSRATVLIQGETGTGKELAARAIHSLSPRADKKFVAVHCKAFSSQLLESELFGHEKGAFTGAFERRIGRFEQAAGGTLFLDEIGEIDENTQVKILRVLGEKTFERVGGNKTLEADVRLLTATNKDLSSLVAEGKFRDDLFFRINVVQITMPPLRNRKEDIPLLAASFLAEACKENGLPPREIPPEIMVRLMDYDWPGNVRELRTAVEHAVVMSTSTAITARDLPPALRTSGALKTHPQGPASPGEEVGGLNLQSAERLLILQALEESSGNRTLAAKRLGISRRTLHRRLKELNLFKRKSQSSHGHSNHSPAGSPLA
ncbi:MAG: sigma-54 dependent transcriptional regulator [Terrimicrobiaceae bacterium]